MLKFRRLISRWSSLVNLDVGSVDAEKGKHDGTLVTEVGGWVDALSVEGRLSREEIGEPDLALAHIDWTRAVQSMWV